MSNEIVVLSPASDSSDHASGRPQSVKPEIAKLLISLEELAAMLGISPRSVWRRLSSGEMIAPVRLGRSVRWRLAEVEAWVAAGCPPVPPQVRKAR